MGASLPNPTAPTNGQPLDATPILQNELALLQAIQSFDGSQIQAGSVSSTALASTINPNTLINQTTFPFVASGCVWSTVSGLNGTMTAGTIYYNGIPVTVNSVASQAFTASKDTYIDVDFNGNITYQAVSTNAAAPSLTANSIRLAICVAGLSITSWNQGDPAAVFPIASNVAYSVQDSLGNLIYPTDPARKILGYRLNVASQGSSGTGATDIIGLSCPVIVPTGRKIKLSMYIPGIQSSGSPNGLAASVNIQESSTSLKTYSLTFYNGSVNIVSPYLEALILPTAGLHTYKGTVTSTNGSFTVTTSAAASLKVELA